ncbi:MAG: S41 family peptidase [Bacillota bacterium]
MKKTKRVLLITLIIFTFTSINFADTTSLETDQISKEYETLDYLIETVLDNFQSSVIDKEVTKEKLIEGAYKGVFEKLDKHSAYMNKEEFKEFNESTEGSFGGIGITVSKGERYIEIISPIEDTPGDRANLKSGDLITEVNGESMLDKELHEAVKLMRGEPGTNLTLTIQRNGNEFEVEITREIIEVETVKYEVKKDDIGYLRITRFNSGVYNEVKDALLDLKDKGVNSLIIDLRNNPGGYLTEVIKISDLFIDPDKNILHIDYKSQEDVTEKTKNKDLFEKDIVVLANEGSASASEILTGAIIQNDEGIAMGTKTYGKGTVQTLKPLLNGGAVKITVAEYMTANKSHINNKGIKPTIKVEQTYTEHLDEDKRHLAPFSLNDITYYGQESLNVYGLQQRLNILGYELNEDGSFGPKTLKVLNEFQRDNDLKQTKYINKFILNYISDKIKNLSEEDLVDLQLEKAIEHLNK